MKQLKKIYEMLFFAVIMLLPRLAFADPAADGGTAAGGDADIWGTLADKAKTVGEGLADAGYIIAGLGLVVFSFMAIFNKIKWSTLAYIMTSVFVLSAMTFVIRSAQKDGNFDWIGGDGNLEYSQKYDITENGTPSTGGSQVDKTTK